MLLGLRMDVGVLIAAFSASYFTGLFFTFSSITLSDFCLLLDPSLVSIFLIIFSSSYKSSPHLLASFLALRVLFD